MTGRGKHQQPSSIKADPAASRSRIDRQPWSEATTRLKEMLARFLPPRQRPREPDQQIKQHGIPRFMAGGKVGRGAWTAQTDQDCQDSLPPILHGLSQPLTALRGSLELALLTEQSVEEYRRTLKETLAQADQLARSFASLRELVEAADPLESTEAVDIAGVVRNVIEEMQPLAESREMRLVLELKSEPCVRANLNRTRQVLARVILHAIERSRPGGTVSVELTSTSHEVCLLVLDQGPLVGPDGLDHLRSPVSLGCLFAEASKHGTLEWAIAKRALEAQGATVRVEERAAQGCCFRMCIPIATE